ncbi:hypothetical protein EY653_05510 [Enterococcus faecalis]|uniref:TcpD family membrane protein n=1 Tax=Enterococcus faecalis TaxID=1351 RepID=UPI001AD72341|nr:TcpD family membrane protein [Enterococcus faecalis]MBO6438758.1 hypothetical protein [Enterococcus faecalis]MBO6453353.1 hypothetical protein [Enterococcus faecalis]
MTDLLVKKKMNKRVWQQRMIVGAYSLLLFLFNSTPVFAAEAVNLSPFTNQVLGWVGSIVGVLAVIQAVKEWQQGSPAKMVITILVAMFLFWFSSSPETVLNKGNDLFSSVFGG